MIVESLVALFVVVLGFTTYVPLNLMHVRETSAEKLQITTFGVKYGLLVKLAFVAAQVILAVLVGSNFKVPVTYGKCRYLAEEELPSAIVYGIEVRREPAFTRIFNPLDISSYTTAVMRRGPSTVTTQLVIPDQLRGFSAKEFYDSFYRAAPTETPPFNYTRIFGDICCRNGSDICSYLMVIEPSMQNTLRFNARYRYVDGFPFIASLITQSYNTSQGVVYDMAPTYGTYAVVNPVTFSQSTGYVRFLDEGRPVLGGVYSSTNVTVERNCSTNIVISKTALNALEESIDELYSDISSYNTGISNVNAQIKAAEQEAHYAAIRNRNEVAKAKTSVRKGVDDVAKWTTGVCIIFHGAECVKFEYYEPRIQSPIPNIEVVLPFKGGVSMPGTREVELCDTVKTITTTPVEVPSIVKHNADGYKTMAKNITVEVNRRLEDNIALANTIAGVIVATRILLSSVIIFKSYPMGVYIRLLVGSFQQLPIFIAVLAIMYLTLDNVDIYINKILRPMINYVAGGACIRDFEDEDNYREQVSSFCYSMVVNATNILKSINYDTEGCGNSTSCPTLLYHRTLNCSDVPIRRIDVNVNDKDVMVLYNSGLVYNLLRDAAGASILLLAIDIGLPLVRYAGVDTVEPLPRRKYIYLAKWVMYNSPLVALISTAIGSSARNITLSLGDVIGIIIALTITLLIPLTILKYYSTGRLLYTLQRKMALEKNTNNTLGKSMYGIVRPDAPLSSSTRVVSASVANEASSNVA